MLVKVDRTSMLNSIECRSPYLTKNLANLIGIKRYWEDKPCFNTDKPILESTFSIIWELLELSRINALYIEK